jgi:hypothetical protein
MIASLALPNYASTDGNKKEVMDVIFPFSKYSAPAKWAGWTALIFTTPAPSLHNQISLVFPRYSEKNPEQSQRKYHDTLITHRIPTEKLERENLSQKPN